MNPTWAEITGTALFALAVIHTFLVGQILKFSHRFPKGSTANSVLHLFGEIEVVFGLWAAALFVLWGVTQGFGTVVEYQKQLHFTEPIFVFCIMVLASTRPVLVTAQKSIQALSTGLRKIFRTPAEATDIFTLFIVGPLAGSLITEPAAMTVSALLLSRMIKRTPSSFLYLLLATLFVNVSIGGALTPFAAPPILMVAAKWNWGLAEVFDLFGYKSLLAVTINSALLVLAFRGRWNDNVHSFAEIPKQAPIPTWVSVVHLIFLLVLVLCAHHPSLAMGVFLFFLGVTTVTKAHQDTLRLKESLLVAFFLAGIIVFGPLQSWWLTPVLSRLDSFALLVGATVLTAVTDNAALTFLGSQVEGLSEASKYDLVAGAITGGGLTLIANAPNAAGYGILQNKFSGGLHPGRLLLAALVPTLVAFLAFAFLPS